MEKLLKLAEFAEALRITISTARAWRLAGRIKIVKIGGAVRVPSSEVERLVREGTVPARGRAA